MGRRPSASAAGVQATEPLRLPPCVHPLTRLARRLRQGAVGVFPTESSYALGALPHHPGAIARLRARKGRRSRHPLPLIACDHAAVLRVCHLPPELAPLATYAWPGPVSLVLPLLRPQMWPEGLAADDGTVAVRISAHPWARRLARLVGGWVVSTSANATGASPWLSPQPRSGWARRLPVAWAGHLPGGPPSTLVAHTSGALVELRAGAVPWPQILAVWRQGGGR